jgi:alkanesulfonate monooxygenase SsuD/methylene tetrahydromethanopterin reductase-like flavin-dependent oxidoreductase (luciferase family)
MSERLKFGVMHPMQCPPGTDEARLVADVVRLAEHADERGFDIYTTVEHPFFPDLSINTNPLALFCTLAQRTKRLRFRPVCFTLPLHNPVVLAGEIALADILMGGRLDCGVGRGHAWLWGPAGVPMEEVPGRYEESLDILFKAWTEERFSYHGKYYRLENVTVVPKPFQRPHPPIFQVSTSDRWFKLAAERGWGITIGGPAPEHIYEKTVATYRAACATAGTVPYIAYSKPIYLADDEATAMREAALFIPKFIAGGFSPLPTLKMKTADDIARLERAGYGVYASEAFGRLSTMSFEELVHHKLVYVGTPEKVADQLLDLWSRFRFRELIVVVHYAGIERWRAMRTQELFASRIMPILLHEIGAAGARRSAAE